MTDNKQLKPFLVDVPVAIQAFVRPQMLEKQWAVIKQARPSILFVRSDGPRENVPADRDLIARSRAITEDVDWECTVYRLYQEKNIGMYGMMDYTQPFIWDKVDRCIFLEDDQVPAVGFFRWCAEMLERYKDDLRIYRITGVNLCGTWDATPNDYFFAKVPTSSGSAMWRRTYEARDTELKYAKDPYMMAHLNRHLPWYLKKQFRSFAETGTYAYHKPAGEFFSRAMQNCQNQLVIVPKYNQIANIGIGGGSTHTASNMKTMPKALQKQSFMETPEFTFPLKHPEFVFADVEFGKEREKYLGVRSKWQNTWRNLERYARLLIFGEFKKIFSGISRKMNKTIEK